MATRMGFPTVGRSRAGLAEANTEARAWPSHRGRPHVQGIGTPAPASAAMNLRRTAAMSSQHTSHGHTHHRGQHHDHHGDAGHHHAPAQDAGATALATDPVCGMTVDPATSKHRMEHGGSVFHFCSAGCRVKFAADPAKYLAPKAAAPAPASGDDEAVYTQAACLAAALGRGSLNVCRSVPPKSPGALIDLQQRRFPAYHVYVPQLSKPRPPCADRVPASTRPICPTPRGRPWSRSCRRRRARAGHGHGRAG